MNKAKNKPTVKWLLYIVCVLILFLFQCAPTRIALFADVLFVLPFVISFSCFEKLSSVVTMAVVCGIFWDFTAQRLFGFHAIVLCILAVASHLAMKFYLRPSFASAAIVTVVSVAIYCLLDFFLFYVIRDYSSLWSLFFARYLPEILKTVIFGTAICALVMKIYNTSPNKARFDI